MTVEQIKSKVSDIKTELEGLKSSAEEELDALDSKPTDLTDAQQEKHDQFESVMNNLDSAIEYIIEIEDIV